MALPVSHYRNDTSTTSTIVLRFDKPITVYITGRFLLGFGNSLAQMASPLLLTEICHPQHRGPVTAIYNCLWNLGALFVSSIGWGTAFIDNDWSWRSITLMQTVPSVIQITFIWWLPESPRYLVNKDRDEEALLVLSKHHAGGNIHNAIVQFEFQEIKQTIQMDRDADKSTSYLDFLRSKGNMWRLAIIVSLGIISQYSGNALFSNYINIIYEAAGITQQSQKLAMSTGKTILDLIVTIAAALTVDRFGRRPLFLISTSGMVVAFACWTVAGAIYENSNIDNIQSGYAQLVFIWIFGIFYDIGFSGLLVAYALEILPFHLRAKGMIVMNITVQAVLAVGKFVLLHPLHTGTMLIMQLAKRTRLLGTTSHATGYLCYFTLAGIWLSCCSYGSFTSRRKARRSKQLRVSLTVMMRWPISIYMTSQKRFMATFTKRLTLRRTDIERGLLPETDIILERGSAPGWSRWNGLRCFEDKFTTTRISNWILTLVCLLITFHNFYLHLGTFLFWKVGLFKSYFV